MQSEPETCLTDGSQVTPDTVQEIQAQNTELRELLSDARDSVEYEMNTLLPHAGYPRYAENIAALRGRLQLIDAALAAKEE